MKRVLRKAERFAERAMSKLFPDFYHRLHFRWLDGRAWGNLDKVWSTRDVSAAKETYSALMLPILQRYIPQPVDLLVDIGCGIGTYSVFLKDFARRIIAVDFMKKRIERAKERNAFGNVEYRVADARNLSFLEANTVDVIHTMAVLVHLTEQMKRDAIEEMKRVLRPGGIIILWDNFDDKGQGVTTTSPHVHVPSRAWLTQAFSPLSVEVVREVDHGSRPKIMVARE